MNRPGIEGRACRGGDGGDVCCDRPVTIDAMVEPAGRSGPSFALAAGGPSTRRETMRKLYWLLGIGAFCVFSTSSNAFAQAKNYQPVRVDSGISGSYVSNSGRGGIGAQLEVKFLPHDQFAVGGRIEGQAMFG